MISLPNTTLYPSALMALMQGVLANSAFSNYEPLLPIIEPVKPIMGEKAHLALVLFMASFWRFVDWFQYLVCLLCVWYLVYQLMKRLGNPPGVSGRRKELTDFAFASSYPYLDLLIRYCLAHFCPDLSHPLTPYILSPWLARLAGYAALTLGLLVLRLIVFVGGRLAYYGKYFIEAIQRREQWYHTTFHMDLRVRLFWAVWYGGYNALYNLQVIGYSARDRTGGRWGDIISGLRLVMQSFLSIQKAARRAGLPHDPEGVLGINLLFFDIFNTQYLHLVTSHRVINQELSSMFHRMCDMVQLCSSLEQWDLMYHYIKAMHTIFFQDRLAHPTQSRLDNIPRTWYAFVFDVLGGTRVLAGARYVKNLIRAQVIEWVVTPLRRFLRWISEVVYPFLLNNPVHSAILSFLLIVTYHRPMVSLVGLVGALLIRLTYKAIVWLYRRLVLQYRRSTFVKVECGICNEMIEEYDESAMQMAACHGHELHHKCLHRWVASGNPEFTRGGRRGCPICRRPVNFV